MRIGLLACLMAIYSWSCSAAAGDDLSSRMRNNPRFAELNARLEEMKKRHGSSFNNSNSSSSNWNSPSSSSTWNSSRSNSSLHSSNSSSSRTSGPDDLKQTPLEGIPAYPNVLIVTGKSSDNPSVSEGNIFVSSSGVIPTTAKRCNKRVKMVKFYTKDKPTLVYNFYVRNLQAKGWRFTDTKTPGEINAKNTASKLAVVIRYEQLPAPYTGTAVAITHMWTSIAPPDKIGIGESPDTDDSHLRLMD
jgi:hypothetical protein